MNTTPPSRTGNRRHIALRLCGLVPLLLVACATPGPTPGPGSTTPAAGDTGLAPRAAPPAPAPSPLATEKRWLDDWFRGTPVVIALQGPATLAVDVPLANSFETGSTAPKAALVAVIERVAESLRRQTGTRVSVAAAADAGATPAQAQARAQRVRDLLVARQVAATRVSTQPGSAAGSGVQLRISVIAAPIAQLDDGTLPPPAGGVKPVATKPPVPAANTKPR